MRTFSKSLLGNIYSETHHSASKSHLPTFNSNAIEAELHNLHDPECFIYLNDDVMFTSHIWPSDFINPETGIQEIGLTAF